MIDLTEQRILIAGGDGFVGRWVQRELAARGVAAEDVLVPLHADYDLTREGDVERMYAQMRPDVVMHLAGEVGGIGANRESPGRFFYANMIMGVHLIEHARRAGVEKFLQVGSVCAYPKHTPVPFREADLWDGYPEETNAPYGIAKRALLVMLQAYRQQYGLNGIYLLPVNLYGPGDDFDPQASHVIPAMIRKFSCAKRTGAEEVSLWGTGNASREFLYVADCAQALVAALAQYDGAEPINVGSGSEITIADLAATIASLMDYQGRITWDTTQPDGQPRRSLDVSLAERLFGFRAQTSLEGGLRQTIDWYLRQDDNT